MYAPDPLTFAYRTSSYAGNPAVSPGTAITGGNSNADGTAVALIGTALTHDCEMLEVVVSAATATAQTGVDTSMILDLLIDPAGGTAWDTTNLLIEGLMVGFLGIQSSTSGNATRKWRFPLWIPAGATIAGRARSTAAAGNTAFEALIIARGGINRPENYWCGQKVDAIGINRAASGGASVAVNASANTYSAFASLGSATGRRYGCLVPGISAIGTAVNGAQYQMQIGVGGVQVGPEFNYATTSAEVSTDLREDKNIYVNVPEATQLQCKIRSSGVSSANQQVIIHGVA